MSQEHGDTNIFVHKGVDSYKMKEAYLAINYDEQVIKKYRNLNKS